MSDSDDQQRAEMSIEFRLERSKRIRRQMDDVVRLWLEGLSVTLIAQRLQVQRHRVYFLLRALELRDSRTTSGKGRWPSKRPRPSRLYGQRGLRVPLLEDNCVA